MFWGQNLINFGIIPLKFVSPSDWDKIDQDDELLLENAAGSVVCKMILMSKAEAIQKGNEVTLKNKTKNQTYKTRHDLNKRELDIILAGSCTNYVIKKRGGTPALQEV